MNQVDVALQVCRDGVGKGTNDRPAGRGMVEHGEPGFEQLVRLADRDGELEPVARRGHLGGLDAVLRQPGVDRCYGLWLWGDKCLHLRKR